MIPNFQQFLKMKSLQELAGQAADAATQTAILGQAVGAQQPTNPANVADNLAKKNAALVLAIAKNPVVSQLQALTAKKNAATNPTNSTNSAVAPNAGASLGTPNL